MFPAEELRRLAKAERLYKLPDKRAARARGFRPCATFYPIEEVIRLARAEKNFPFTTKAIARTNEYRPYADIFFPKELRDSARRFIKSERTGLIQQAIHRYFTPQGGLHPTQTSISDQSYYSRGMFLADRSLRCRYRLTELKDGVLHLNRWNEFKKDWSKASRMTLEQADFLLGTLEIFDTFQTVKVFSPEGDIVEGKLGPVWAAWFTDHEGAEIGADAAFSIEDGNCYAGFYTKAKVVPPHKSRNTSYSKKYQQNLTRSDGSIRWGVGRQYFTDKEDAVDWLCQQSLTLGGDVEPHLQVRQILYCKIPKWKSLTTEYFQKTKKGVYFYAGNGQVDGDGWSRTKKDWEEYKRARYGFSSHDDVEPWELAPEARKPEVQARLTEEDKFYKPADPKPIPIRTYKDLTFNRGPGGAFLPDDSPVYRSGFREWKKEVKRRKNSQRTFKP